MILGVGSDIIEVGRIDRMISLYGDRFLDRHFTKEEQAYCNRFKDKERRYAGRFAAKEALAKALGTGIQQDVQWLSFSILPDEQGKPSVYLLGALKEQLSDRKIHLTISHSEEYAVAFAVIEANQSSL